MKIALITLLALTPTAALAEQTEYRPGGMSEETCFKYEYREEYVPGTENSPGYVKSWKDTVEVPCEDTPTYRTDPNPDIRRNTRPVPMPSYRRHVTVYEDVDTNDCSDGTVAGALLGG